MDFRNLVKKATEKVTELTEKSRPVNPQVLAIADLVAREVTLDAKDLNNLFFSAGGGYLETIKGDDIQRLKNARALFGHLKDRPPIQVVGYLTPDSNGGVIISVNGTPVDRLVKVAAKSVRSKISGPTPVKIEVTVIPSRDPKYDRPHLKLKKDNKPPKS
jgi:hypothetical protein